MLLHKRSINVRVFQVSDYKSKKWRMWWGIMFRRWWIVARGWRICKRRAIVWTWLETNLEKPRGERNEKRGCRTWNQESSLSASPWRSYFLSSVGNDESIDINTITASHSGVKSHVSSLLMFPVPFFLIFDDSVTTMTHQIRVSFVFDCFSCFVSFVSKNVMFCISNHE